MKKPKATKLRVIYVDTCTNCRHCGNQEDYELFDYFNKEWWCHNQGYNKRGKFTKKKPRIIWRRKTMGRFPTYYIPKWCRLHFDPLNRENE